MKLIQLPELQTTEATNGGVLITSSETSDNLVINGGLEDQTIGYSAEMPFASAPLMQSEPEPVTIAELGLMSGAADPMMLFPAGTTFTPYSVLRNVSDAPLSITPTLWWMEGGTPHSALLPQITLPSLQTQSLDVASLLALFGPKNFNGSFNLTFETQATFGSLVMAAGSVDQTGTYVFEVGPRGVGESASKSLQQWSTANGDDTMVTVWNPADEAQDFVFTLFFEGGHYLLPLHIQPKETRSFDVSEIIQNQVPDAEGNLVPSTVHQGTAKIAGSLAENQYILVAIEAGIYNVRKATCSQSCQWCDGYNSFYLIDAPFGVAVNGTHQESAMAQYHSGTIYNLTTGSSWGSSNTTVATVGTGLVTGKAAGSVTMTATLYSAPVDAGYICTGGNPCPLSNFQNTAAGCVDPVPSSETTTYAGTTYGTEGSFIMTLNPSTCSFNGHNVQETNYATDTDTCFWPGANITNPPAVAGSTWLVGSGTGIGVNQYGIDSIGFSSSGVNYIQANAGEHDVDFPCVVTFYQQMSFETDANTYQGYAQNVDTQTIGGTTVKVCRAGVCTGTLTYPY